MKKLKQLYSILLAVVFIGMLTACSGGSSAADSENTSTGGSYVDRAVISGEIQTSCNRHILAKLLSLTRVTTRQEGGLWISAGHIINAVKVHAAETTASAVPAPISSAIKVNIQSDCTFDISNILSGTGYTLTYISDDGQSGQQISGIDLSPGDTLEKLFDDMQPTGSVVMSIVSLVNGHGISDASITLLETGATSTSDAATGAASFTGLPQGTYGIVIEKEGFVPKYMTFNISAGQETDIQVIELNSTKGSASGRVTAQGITDYSNIIVYAKAADGSVLTTLTDTDGQYQFAALPVDSGYSIVAMAHDFDTVKTDNIMITAENETVVGDMVLSRISNSTAFTIDLAAGGTTTSELGTLAGFARYVDKQELRHEGIIVSIEGTDMEAITSRDGSFVINSIPQGRYTINFIESNYQTTTLYGVKVVAGAAAQMEDIVLEKRVGTVSGFAQLDDQSNHAGIKVSLTGSDYYTYTDGSGQWRMDAPLGNYHSIEYSKDLYGIKSISETVTITEFGTYRAQDAVLVQNARYATGNITIDGVTDYSMAQITFTGAGGDTSGMVFQVSVAADGSYTSDGLPLGEYIMSVAHPGGFWETVVVDVSLISGASTAVVPVVHVRQSYVSINAGEEYTDDRNVTLSIGNTEAVLMTVYINNVDQGEEAYATSKMISVGYGDGEKTVVVSFKDSNGAVLPSVSDTITLDTTISVNDFSGSGATAKGDTLRVILDVGEPGGVAKASLVGLFNELDLYDTGAGGDVAADDGIYTRTVEITDPTELDAPLTGSFVDRAGNSANLTSNSNIVLATAPTISGVAVSSDALDGEMQITFGTDEPTLSSIRYGSSYADLNTTLDVSDIHRQTHTILLTGLSASQVVYFELTATDSAGLTSVVLDQRKLAPDAPRNLVAEAGSGEVGIAWAPPISTDILGYYVYRSVDGGNTFQKVTAHLVETYWYLDQSVANGRTYHYYVVAIDSGANESNAPDAVSASPNASLAGPTEISGGVTDSYNIWLSSRSPYQLTGSYRVREAGELLMMAGTEIEVLADDLLWQIDGKLTGLGTASAPISIVSSGITPMTEVTEGSHACSVKVDGSFRMDYAEIENINFEGNVALYHSEVDLDFSIVNKFQILRLESSILESQDANASGYSFSEISIEKLLSSEVSMAYGDGFEPSEYTKLKTVYMADTSVANSRIEQADMMENCSFDNVYLDSYVDHRINGGTVRNSTFNLRGNFVMNRADIDTNSVFRIDETYFTYTYDISSNYWGTTDLQVIGSVTGYYPGDNRKLYPIISTADIATADADGDGILDYIDNDNDNDGYSDLQEDKESDPVFNVYYNPLDASSFPSSEMDNDYDGVPDVIDSDDDNDGLDEADEAVYGTYPLIADSDADGTTDGDEIAFKYDPMDGTNYPYFGFIRNATIDSSNSNNEGVVLVGKDMVCNDCEVKPGVNLTLSAGVSLTFDDCEVVGSRAEPIIIRQAGDNAKLYNGDTSTSLISYANIDVSLFENKGTVSYSDIKNITNENSGVVEYSTLFEQDESLYGEIKNSYIYYGSSIWFYGTMTDSYVGARMNLYDSANVVRSYLEEATLFGGDASESILDLTSYAYYDSVVTASDVYLYDSRYTSYNTFFNACYLEHASSGESYVGLGYPTDTFGDKVYSTEFTLSGNYYTVDGIKDPQTVAYYPDFVRDPSVAGDLWNPGSVGCLWDPTNPTEFPEP